MVLCSRIKNVLAAEPSIYMNSTPQEAAWLHTKALKGQTVEEKMNDRTVAIKYYFRSMAVVPSEKHT